MQSNLDTLFEDLTALCSGEESSFYSVDHVRNGVTYRVFTYRLASYTEFQQRNAIECRGHTFRLDGENDWTLASLPMQKFWNYGELVNTINTPEAKFRRASEAYNNGELSKELFDALRTKN